MTIGTLTLRLPKGMGQQGLEKFLENILWDVNDSWNFQLLRFKVCLPKIMLFIDGRFIIFIFICGINILLTVKR